MEFCDTCKWSLRVSSDAVISWARAMEAPQHTLLATPPILIPRLTRISSLKQQNSLLLALHSEFHFADFTLTRIQCMHTLVHICMYMHMYQQYKICKPSDILYWTSICGEERSPPMPPAPIMKVENWLTHSSSPSPFLVSTEDTKLMKSNMYVCNMLIKQIEAHVLQALYFEHNIIILDVRGAQLWW